MPKRRTEMAKARQGRTKATKPKGPSKYSQKGRFIYQGTGVTPLPTPYRVNKRGAVR